MENKEGEKKVLLFIYFSTQFRYNDLVISSLSWSLSMTNKIILLRLKFTLIYVPSLVVLSSFLFIPLSFFILCIRFFSSDHWARLPQQWPPTIFLSVKFLRRIISPSFQQATGAALSISTNFRCNCQALFSHPIKNKIVAQQLVAFFF